MRIASVKAAPLAGSVEKPIWFGIGPFPTFYATLVEVRTDDGRVGVGECIARKAPRVTATIVEDLLTPVVLGRDPRDVTALWDEMFEQLRRWGHSRGFLLEAISGVDIALWDLLAQASGEPLYRTLRGAGRTQVPCYASSVYFAPIEHMVEEALSQVRHGHKMVKVKIGRNAAMGGRRTDVASVRAIREAVGPEIGIMLDVNSAYDAAGAIMVCRELEPLDILWIEEPVPPDDLSGYELIRRSQRIPVAAGESEFGIFGFRDLIERRAVDVLQPDIARIGGFTAAMRLGTLAQAYHLAYAPHTGFSGGVSHLAALHLAAAVPNLFVYEYMFIQNPLRDIFTTPFPEPRDGVITLPERPGLGLELDWETVRGYQVRP